MAQPLNMHEVFEVAHGAPARSFPSVLPVFRLDRIYVRGFRIGVSHAHSGNVWARISDHAVLTTALERI